VVFAIAAAVFWTDLATAIDTALDDIEGCIDGSDTSCTTG
jgi:hypothetical protein